MVAIERSHFEPGAFGSPALIPDLILPVEVGIGGGPTKPQQHRESTVLMFPINFEIVARSISQWLSLCCTLFVEFCCELN